MTLQTSELSTWLGTYTWDYFFTVTNRRPRRDSISFIRDIGNTLTEKESAAWSNPDSLYLPSRVFIACEPHRFNRNLHAHGLIHGLSGIYPPSVFNKVLNKRFGFSRVETCRSQSHVTSYLAKYVTKTTDGDNYDFLGYWGK